MSILPLPSQFKVDAAHDAFKVHEKVAVENSTCSKVCRFVCNLLSIIIFPIGICRLIGRAIKRLIDYAILPASEIYRKEQALHQRRDRVIAAKKLQQVTIETADGAKLDTVMIEHAEQKLLPSAQQKWIICLHGNGMCYEQSLGELLALSKELKVNVYTGNYRGVMRSEGHATSSDQLVLDGEAMVQYLMHLGVLEKNMLIKGFSLGGAVAPAVCALHQRPNCEMSLFSDRSFAGLSNVIKAWTPYGLGWLGFIVAKIVSFAGWRFNNVENFRKVNGFKFTCHSKEDGVILYAASLYKGIKEAQMTPADKQAKKMRRAAKAKGGAANQANAAYPQNYKPKHAIKLDLSKEIAYFKKEECGQAVHCLTLEEHVLRGVTKAYRQSIRYTRIALSLNS